MPLAVKLELAVPALRPAPPPRLDNLGLQGARLVPDELDVLVRELAPALRHLGHGHDRPGLLKGAGEVFEERFASGLRPSGRRYEQEGYAKDFHKPV